MKNNIKRTFLAAAFAAGLLLNQTGCSVSPDETTPTPPAPTNPEPTIPTTPTTPEPTIPTQPTVPTPPVIEEVTPIELKDVEDLIAGGNVGGRIGKEIRSVIDQLANQNRILLQQCQSEKDANNLAGYLHFVRTNIAAPLQNGTNVISIKNTVSPYIDALTRRFSSEAMNQANAFREANYLNQRTEFNATENENAMKADLLARINTMGINATTLPQAITALKAALKTSMPQEIKPYADGLLQQLEDITQGIAYTDDLRLFGYDLKAVPRTQQARSAIQAENGIVK